MNSFAMYRALHLNFRRISANRALAHSSTCIGCSSTVHGNVSLLQRHDLCTTSALSQSSSSNSNSKRGPTFASLLRNSPLVQLGLPEGKVVIGNIVEVVGDDLYIDFGFKFNAVVRRPKMNPGSFVRGATVKVRINDLELSDRFLGSSQDMTLLEADVTLLALVSSPVKSIKVETN